MSKLADEVVSELIVQSGRAAVFESEIAKMRERVIDAEAESRGVVEQLRNQRRIMDGEQELLNVFRKHAALLGAMVDAKGGSRGESSLRKAVAEMLKAAEAAEPCPF